jgi:chemotaxis response regulator CheB
MTLTGQTGSSAPPSVLVIEDEALIAMVVSMILTEAGYAICGVAGNAAAALDIAARERP